MVSTNFSSPVSPNSENYLKSIHTKDVLLLEGGDEVLLETGDSILLEITDLNSTNFSSPVSANSTNYS